MTAKSKADRFGVFSSEEDVKTKLLMPYLADLGFDPSEISLESTFKIRLGKGVHEVNESHSGRLDIACHKDHQYLFVLELKSSELALTDDDRDQGISYARLLENIAPFVIVSNGSTTAVYDTVTREKIDGDRISAASSFWRGGCTLATPDDLEIRHSALMHFVGRSPENLGIFSRAQVGSRMSNLTGDPHDLYAKYVSKLFVDREAVDEQFSRFLESPFPVFAIIGESGVGKTNVVCHLCESNIGSHLALFYNASVTTASLNEMIAADLNLFFSARSDSQKVLTELAKTPRSAGDVLIFVDAVDECPRGQLRHELGEVALALKEIKGVRLCVSCKTAVWDSFLFLNGTKSYLYDAVFPYSRTSYGRTNSGEGVKGPGFELQQFSEAELEKVLPLYAQFYELTGPFSGALKEHFKLGLLLRLFSHVHRGQRVPAKIDSIRLLESYLRAVASKMKQVGPEAVIAILSAVGRLLLEDEKSGHFGGNVTTTALKKELAIPPVQEVPTELFEYNLLLRVNQNGVYSVSFYYTLLRDYVICFQTMRLQDRRANDFDSALKAMTNGQTGLSAIRFYAMHATSSQIQAITEFMKNRFLFFIEAYDDILNRNFPRIKKSFDPNTSGPIGIVIPANFLTGPEAYALFPAENAEGRRRVQTVEPWDDRIFHLYKARIIHGRSYEPLLTAQTEHQVWPYVHAQLAEIVSKGMLNELESETLLREQIANIVYFYHRALRPDVTIEDLYYPRYDAIYPIVLEEVAASVRRFFAEHYFRERQVAELIRDGKVHGVKNSYWYTEDQLNSDRIKSEAETALRTGVKIPEPQTSGDSPPFVPLMRMVDQLLRLGVHVLDKHYLPGPDVSIQEARERLSRREAQPMWISSLIAAEFTSPQEKNYIQDFLQTVERAYVELVESCFPSIKDNLSFYATRPHRYFVRYQHDGREILSVGYAMAERETADVCFIDEQMDDVYRKYKLSRWSVMGRPTIFSCPDALPTMKGFRTVKVDEFCVVRNWVYDLLKDDISEFTTRRRG